jgi:sec-independent protein translocase protein TatA
MGGFSLWHILIFAIIVLLLFGGNRFSNMMGDVAKGLKSFKKGMSDEDEQAQQRPPEAQRQIPPHNTRSEPIDITPRAADPVQPPPADDSQPR